MRGIPIFIAIFCTSFFGWNRICAQSQSEAYEGITRVLFVLDASSSMKKEWGSETKWATARRVLIQRADSLDKTANTEFGLRIYGHMSAATEKDCADSRLEVSIGTKRADLVRQKLEEVKPKGITPISYSLEKTIHDFPQTTGRHIIVLITDGEESCEGDPCAIALDLQRNDIILKPFVIGLDITDASLESYDCIGTVYNATKPEEFEYYLNLVLTRLLAQTTLQVNLNDDNGEPTETNVNMTFYDEHTNIAKYNLYHTMNHRGLSDTLVVDPVYGYRVVVHTIPPVQVDHYQMTPGKHNVLDIDAGQGFLKLELKGSAFMNNFNNKIKSLVKPSGKHDLLNIQPFNSSEKYLTGSYDLEFLTLPRIKMHGVKIEQSKTTTIGIPAPGVLTLNKSQLVLGGIFMFENNKMVKIYELGKDARQETIALQPGTYRIVYRPKYAKTMHATVDREIEIVSSGSLALDL